uniref:Uncharacterized protein n=1 Tax=Takifugu rubripes TaxID=31033 RepID=A0A3B5K348_TAKRU
MRCHTISIFLSGHSAQSCNFLARKRKESRRRWRWRRRRRRRRKSHIWLHPRHLTFDQADCDQVSNESALQSCVVLFHTICLDVNRQRCTHSSVCLQSHDPPAPVMCHQSLVYMS